MNKINFITLIVFTAAVAGCYQKTPTSNVQPNPRAEKTMIEKSVEISNQTDKSGDYDAALNYYNAKNYEKAAAEFEQVVKTDGKNHQAHFYLGKSRQALNKPDEAIAAYKKAIAIKPDYAEANYELGSIYLNKKDYETSLPFIEKAAKIKYTSVDYLLALGDNYRELGRCNYAVVPYGKVSGFDDKNTAAYYGMGLCYIELKNRIAAAQQVRNLESLDVNLAKKLADKIPK